ncbi:MAG TPA: SRPBCC family protein [Anaerolineae bacterium]
MWDNEVTIDIAAPIEKVYQYLADLRRHSEWSMSASKIEQMTPGEIGVGTEFKASEELPQKLESFARMTALDAPTRIAWESTDYQVFRTNWEIVLSAQNGGTHLVQRVTFHTLGALGDTILEMRKLQVPSENLASLNRMKVILER